MFEIVVNPIIEGIKGYVNGIETSILEFFEALGAFELRGCSWNIGGRGRVGSVNYF